MKKNLLKAKNKKIIGNYKYLLLLICNSIFGQYTNIRTEKLKIIDTTFINKINPLPFSANQEDKSYLIEYDSNTLSVYCFNGDDSLFSISNYKIIKKAENYIIFNQYNEIFDKISLGNYHNVEIIARINTSNETLSFYYIDKLSIKENVVCNLRIKQININVGKTSIH